MTDQIHSPFNALSSVPFLDISVFFEVSGRIAISGFADGFANGTEVGILILDTQGNSKTVTAIVQDGAFELRNLDERVFTPGNLTITASAGNTMAQQTLALLAKPDTAPIVIDEQPLLNALNQLSIWGKAPSLEPGDEVKLVIRDVNGTSVTATAAVQSDGRFSVQGISTQGLIDGTLFIDVMAQTDTGTISVMNAANLELVIPRPEGADKTLALNEDTPLALTAADFGYDNSDGFNLTGIKIAGLPGAGRLQLNGVDVVMDDFVSVAQLNAGLLQYRPPLNANGNAFANFKFKVMDNRLLNNEDREANTITFNVTPVNDAPVLATGSTLAYTENAAATAINTAITVADADNATLTTATVSITGGFATGQDVLSFTTAGAATMGNISGAYNGTTGVMTLTSAGGTATLAHWQAALRAVAYRNTSDNPSTAARTVSYSVNDGTVNGNTVTSTINVTAANDAPVLATGSTLAYTENAAATAINTAITVADADNATLTTATVSITGGFATGQDVLSFTTAGAATMGNISGAYNGTTGVMTLTSAGGTATLAHWQAALRAVAYRNTSDNPSTAARTVSYSVNDGTVNGNTVTSTINVTAANDAPVLATGSTLSYTENNAATAINTAITVADADNATLTTATVAITTGFNSTQDVLSLTVNPATMGNIVGAYSTATGVMTLTSAGGTATLAQWQAALRAVAYNNTSDAPSTAARTVSYTVNDGSTTGNTVISTINFTAANDAPVLATGSTLAYTENAVATAINTAITVADADSTTLASATVAITTGFNSTQDVLSLTVNPATMGNIVGAYSAATGVMTLTSAGGTATLAQWQAALRAVAYNNTSDNPSTAARTVSYTVNDGTVNGNTVTSTINVTAVNDAPVVDNLIPDQVATYNAPFSYTVPANTFSDVDSTLTYSATLGSDAALPAWLSFNAATRTFSGTPPNALDINLKVIASDGTNSVSDVFRVAIAPAVTSLAVVSATGTLNDRLNAGDVATIEVNFIETVTVTGTPQLALNIGGTLVQANYVSGSGGTTLTFTYTVQAGQSDPNGISINANALTLNGGTIRDVHGNNAILNTPAVADNTSFKVDTENLRTVSADGMDKNFSLADDTSNTWAVYSDGTTKGRNLYVTVAGTESLQQAQMRLDGGAWTDMTLSGNKAVFHFNTALTAGDYAFDFRTLDLAGNFSAITTQNVSVSSWGSLPNVTTVTAATVSVPNASTGQALLGNGNVQTFTVSKEAIGSYLNNGAANLFLQGGTTGDAGSGTVVDHLTLTGDGAVLNLTDLLNGGYTVDKVQGFEFLDMRASGKQAIVADAISLGSVSTSGWLSNANLLPGYYAMVVRGGPEDTLVINKGGAHDFTGFVAAGTSTNAGNFIADGITYNIFRNDTTLQYLLVQQGVQVSIWRPTAVGAPVNIVPLSVSALQETTKAITDISVEDINGNLSRVQLSVLNGTVSVSLSGTTVSAGALNSSSVTLIGTQAQLNAALATLTYKGNAAFAGTDTLTIVSTDNTGTPLSDTDTVAITVTAVNDAPIANPTEISNILVGTVSAPEVTITDNQSAVSVANGTQVTYTLKFSEAIKASTLTSSDLSVINGTLVAGSLTQVDATTWTVQATAPTGTAAGSTALILADGSYNSTYGVAGLGSSATQGYGTPAVTAATTPEINGTPGENRVPVGWTLTGGTPDTNNYANAVWSSTYAVTNLNGISWNGGEYVNLVAKASNGWTESMKASMTGLTVGQTYTYGVQWQQYTLSKLAGVDEIFAGGQLRVFINGVNQIYTSAGLSDTWQNALFTFVANASSMDVTLLINGTSGSGGGDAAIAVDSLSLSQISTLVRTTGTIAADVLIGADDDETFSIATSATTTATGTDKVFAGAGNDTVIFNSFNAGVMTVDGGSGVNFLQLDAAATATSLDLTDAAVLARVNNFSSIDMTGSGHNVLKLNYAAVVASSGTANVAGTLADESNMLVVSGNAGDRLNLVNLASWNIGPVQTAASLSTIYGSAYKFLSGHSYKAYTLNDATLFVDQAITVASATSSTTATVAHSQAVTIESLFGPQNGGTDTVYSFTDADAAGTPNGTFKGVALTSIGVSADFTSKGFYQLSKDGGATWTNLQTAISGDSAALYADKDALIRYAGALGVEALNPQNLTARLIDNSGETGTASYNLAATGTTINASVNGGATAFSGNTVTLQVTNESPIANGDVSVNDVITTDLLGAAVFTTSSAVTTAVIDGTPSANAPVGWTINSFSPAIQSLSLNVYGQYGYHMSNVDGESLNGGSFVQLKYHDTPQQSDSIKTDFTGLIVGNTYTYGVQWQQMTLQSYSGGQLKITVGNTSQTYASSGVSDGWQTALFTFTATSTSMPVILGINGAVGVVDNLYGAIAVDSMTVQQVAAAVTALNVAGAKTVQELFGDTYTDADASSSVEGTFKGVAITSAGTAASATALGVYQYSSDNGNTWTTLASGLTESTAVFLAKTDLVRFFASSTNASFAMKPDLVARLVDASPASPSNSGQVVNVSGTNHGGSTPYSGDTVTLRVLPDNTPPTLVGSTPSDDSFVTALGNDLVLNFSETVVKGTGLIQLFKVDGTLVESFDAATSTALTWSGSNLTINPTNKLLALTGYYIKIAPTAVKDLGANAYAGITDATTLNFTTTDEDGGIPPTAISGAGYVVSSAGDVNGDGFDDVIVGMPTMNNFPYTGAFLAGGAYVIYGNSSGALPALPKNSSTIATSLGFKIYSGMNAESRFGATVSGIGDINGDGFDDVMMGLGGTNARAFVVYGGATNAGVAIDVAGNINNSQGFKIALASGFDSTAAFGSVVTGLGDVNGDGVADFGVRVVSSLANSYSYVLYGSKTNQSDLVVTGEMNQYAIGDASRGYRLAGLVTAVGDMNNDGIADVVSTTYNSNDNSSAATIYYSNANGTANTTNAAYSVTGTISNSPMNQVTSMGDVNGDGIADLAVMSSRQVFVVYGQTGTTNVALSTLSASQGFKIVLPVGSSRYDWISSAGDVNGDGLADVIIGKQSGYAAFAMVVYGNATGTDVQLSHILGYSSGYNVSDDAIPASQGFKISSLPGGEIGYRVSNAGDFNGDGLADLILGGIPTQDGLFGIVLGGTQFVTNAVQGSGTVNGTSGSEALFGSTANDTLAGGGGVDRFFAGEGNDTIVLTATDVTNLANVTTGQTVKASIDGGGGFDSIRMSGGVNMFLPSISNVGAMGLEENSRIESIERIDMSTDTGVNNLSLQSRDVRDMAGFNQIRTGSVSADGKTWINVTGTALSATTKFHQLVVDGGSNDNLTLAADLGFWSVAGTVNNGTHNYTVYQNTGGNAQVLVRTGVVVTNNDSVAPVVLDLNRDGDLAYSQMLMDVNNDGQLDQTAWAAAQDGVLVWDKYMDGAVHDNSQYAFAQYAGFAGATDLQGLAAAFDSNADGLFSNLDAMYSQFAVWQDLDQDGMSDEGEVRSLADWGVVAINLVSDGVVQAPAVGVQESGRSAAQMADGSEMVVADAAFAYQAVPQLDLAGFVAQVQAESKAQPLPAQTSVKLFLYDMIQSATAAEQGGRELFAAEGEGPRTPDPQHLGYHMDLLAEHLLQPPQS